MQILLTADRASLPAGGYGAEVSVTAGTITKTVLVSLAVVAAVASVEFIDFGTDSRVVQFDAWNAGAGTLQYEVTGAAGWLAVDKPAGSSAGSQDRNTIHLAVDRSSLAAGTYDGQLAIVPVAGQTGSATTIDVSMTVPPGMAGLLTTSAGPASSITAGQTATLAGTATGGTAPYTYSWGPTTGLGTPASATTTAAPASTQTYTLTVRDAAGQTATDSVTVTVATVSDRYLLRRHQRQ